MCKQAFVHANNVDVLSVLYFQEKKLAKAKHFIITNETRWKHRLSIKHQQLHSNNNNQQETNNR